MAEEKKEGTSATRAKNYDQFNVVLPAGQKAELDLFIKM